MKGCVHIFRVIVFYKMREKIWKKKIVVHNKFEMMKLHALSWQVKIVERILFAILKATCIDKHILRTRRHNIFRAPTHLPINYLSNIIYLVKYTSAPQSNRLLLKTERKMHKCLCMPASCNSTCIVKNTPGERDICHFTFKS